MAASLIIESAGPGATIQDSGRNGLLRFGVTPAGPMDWGAFETANIALGNEPGSAAIEIGLGGSMLSVDAPIMLAVAGGGFAWTRGGRAMPPAARILLRPGERLVARPGDWGAFAYCAVPGGIDVPAIMGSRATHTRSALGGIDGRALRPGDRLRVSCDSPDVDDVKLVAPWLQRLPATIRVVLGPQDDHFTEAAVGAFLDAEFKLTAAADRMAYKLEGLKLAHARDFNIVSDGIALGAVQVAGDGQPMVLMADRQPTGGYAKIATVCRADIGRVAQLRPGDTLRFEAIDVAAARDALLNLQRRVAEAAAQVAPLRLLPTAAVLACNNLVSGVTDGLAGIENERISV